MAVDLKAAGPLTAADLQSLQVAKVHRHEKNITGLDFSSDGRWLVVTDEADTIVVYDALAGSMARKLFSKKYGVCHAQFTHAADTVLHASTKGNDGIRYLSLKSNNYIRYFMGHEGQVTSISQDPRNDTFWSAAVDKAVRKWDVRAPGCQAVLYTPGATPTVAFDPQGAIFAVAVGAAQIKLYSADQYTQGPFSTFDMGARGDVTALQFNASGLLMATTTSGHAHVYNTFDPPRKIFQLGGSAFAGNVKHAWFSACGTFIFSATPDGICVHNVGADMPEDADREIALLPGAATQAQQVVFNPSYMELASVHDHQLALWLPTAPSQSF